jgi:hypothetical protein
MMIQVNIGSGVSILRVDSADSFERVGGTSLGGRSVIFTWRPSTLNSGNFKLGDFVVVAELSF